jgi:hypothetical protein
MQAEADRLLNELLNKGKAGEPEPVAVPDPPAFEPASRLAADLQGIKTGKAAQPVNGSGSDFLKPIFTEDYFKHQGLHVSTDVPADFISQSKPNMHYDEKSLMVMMSFQDWLLHFKRNEESHSKEVTEQKALKTMWQKEKLAAAIE